MRKNDKDAGGNRARMIRKILRIVIFRIDTSRIASAAVQIVIQIVCIVRRVLQNRIIDRGIRYIYPCVDILIDSLLQIVEAYWYTRYLRHMRRRMSISSMPITGLRRRAFWKII